MFKPTIISFEEIVYNSGTGKEPGPNNWDWKIREFEDVSSKYLVLCKAELCDNEVRLYIPACQLDNFRFKSEELELDIDDAIELKELEINQALKRAKTKKEKGVNALHAFIDSSKVEPKSKTA